MDGQNLSEDDEYRFEGLTLFETLTELIGDKDATRLCDLFGGRPVYFPKDAFGCKWLIAAVGYEAAEKLCDHFAVGNTGTRVMLPKGDGNNAASFMAEVIRLSDEGLKAPDIAVQLDVHIRSVYRARSRGNELRAKRLSKRITNLLNNGYELDGIAKEIGISIDSVKAIYKKIQGRG